VDLLGGCVGDVEEGDGDVGLDSRGHFVHGVGADEEEVCTGGFDLFSGLGENCGGLVPLTLVLEAFDFFEVDAVEEEFGGVEAA